MRVAYNKYSRRFDFSAPPTFVPVLLAFIACWVVSYLYSVGYPVYGEVSATPLWNTICQTLPGKEFTYIIGIRTDEQDIEEEGQHRLLPYQHQYIVRTMQ